MSEIKLDEMTIQEIKELVQASNTIQDKISTIIRIYLRANNIITSSDNVYTLNNDLTKIIKIEK